MDVLKRIIEGDLSEIIKVQGDKDVVWVSHDIVDVPVGAEKKITFIYGIDDVKAICDSIVIDSSILNKDNVVLIVEKLLEKVRHCVFIYGPTYQDKLGRLTIPLKGERILYPTKFSQFDFFYRCYGVEQEWQIFSFYKKEKAAIKDDWGKLLDDAVSRLAVLYVLPHRLLTGALKYMLNHASGLKKNGHDVYVAVPSQDGTLPSWSDFGHEDFSGVISYDDNEKKSLDAVIKQTKVNVVVVTWYTSLCLIHDKNTPVLYWEQGSQRMYGDWGSILPHNSDVRRQMYRLYHWPNVYYAAVSPILQDIMKARYDISAELLYTGVDIDKYYPVKYKSVKDVVTILMVGNPELPFKGFRLCFEVLDLLWKNGYKFKVKWASQIDVKVSTLYPIEVYVQPKQAKLAELYREADIFIHASVYDSFPMPPMEAMASGTAVVATDSGGISRTYAKPGENIILADTANFRDLYMGIAILLRDEKLRNKLAVMGRQTAEEYALSFGVEQLEKLLYRIVNGNRVHNDNRGYPRIQELPEYEMLKRHLCHSKGEQIEFGLPPVSCLKSRLEVLQELCSCKKVIHVGCTDHINLIDLKIEENRWLHMLLSKCSSKVLGIDINHEAIDYVKNKGYSNVIEGDISKPGIFDIASEHWDYILMADMVEHLDSPSVFLKELKKNYGKYIDKYIITVPNAFGLIFLSMALHRGIEYINDDHRAWYTPYTLMKMVAGAGFTIDSIFTCGYESSMEFLRNNIKSVLEKPILQDTLVIIFR